VSGPTWLYDVAAVLMLAVAVYAVGRVVAAVRLRRGTAWDIDLAHVPMGVAMAGMFVPRLALLPWWVWGVVFGVLTAYFLARGVIPGSRRYLPHAGHAGAMLYMVLALPTGRAGMSAGPPHLPTVAWVLGLFMVGYTVVLARSIGAPPPSPDSLAPGGALAYKLAASVGMGFMLILML